MRDIAFTSGRVCEQAKGNTSALKRIARTYRHKRRLDAVDFVRVGGERFAPSWDELRAEGVVRAARDAARAAGDL